MTATQLEKLTMDERETLEGIDPDNLTKSSYMLLGASLAILNHVDASGDTNVPAMQEGPAREDLAYQKATDELRDSEWYATNGFVEFARDEAKHAQYWIDELHKAAYTDDERRQVQDLTAWLSLIRQKL